MKELAKSGLSLGLRVVTAPKRLVGRMLGRNTAPPREPSGRVLLVCGHWIGDTLWASQVVADLNSSFPSMELHVACKAHGAVFFRDRPGAEFTHICPELISDRTRETVDIAALDACAERLRKIGFEGVIDLTGNRYSARLTSRIKARWTLGFDGDERGFLYGMRVKNAERPGAHHSERPFRVIEALTGHFEPPPVPALPLARGELSEALRGWSGIADDSGLVVVAPGAGWPAKQWPESSFRELVKRLVEGGLSVAVTGSAAEAELCERVAADAAGLDETVRESSSDDIPRHVFVMAGTSVDEIVELIRGARAAVTNDSGLGHVAAAAGIPTFVIFTEATDPKLCGPLGPRAEVVKSGTADADPEVLAARILGLGDDFECEG